MFRRLGVIGIFAILLSILAGCGSSSGTITQVPTRLLVGSFRNDSVMQYDPASGAFMRTFIPADPAKNGGLSGPQAMAIGPDGNLYVSSFNRAFGPGSVLRYNAATGAFIDTFVPANPAVSGGLFGATGLAFGPDGNLYVASALTNAILRYNGRTGAFLGPFVSPDPTKNGGLNGPAGIAFGPDGNLYVGSLNFDIVNDIAFPAAVLRYNGTTGAFIDAFVPPNPARNGGLLRTGGLTFGPDGDLYVAGGDFKPRGSVLKFKGSTGALIGALAPTGILDEPIGVTFGPDGNLYVAAAGGTAAGVTGNGSIRRYNPKTGALIDTFIPSDPAKNGGLTGATYPLFYTLNNTP